MTRVRSRLFVCFLHAVLCVCATGVLNESSASAQTGYPATSDPRLQYVPPARTLEELQREYDAIRLWAPALGMPVSYFAASGGMVMIAAANFDLCLSSTCIDEPRTRSEKAWIAAGGIVIAAGIAGFVASIVRIRQKQQRKHRLRYEMGQLRFGS